jgi:conjugation system TraG family ATPase
MKNSLDHWLPILETSNNLIVSKTGDYTIAYEVVKPEIFTLGVRDYETLQQAWVKAMRLLPYQTIIHVQDWYTATAYQAAPERQDNSMLTNASEKFFHGRPYLENKSYLFLTKVPIDRKPTRTGLSPLLRKTLIPEETLRSEPVQRFLDQAAQFINVLMDSKLIGIRQLCANELTGNGTSPGIIEQYCQLTDQSPANNSSSDSRINWSCEGRDIDFRNGIRIGDYYCPLYTLSDIEHLPAQCSSRTDYEPYSIDHTPFSIGFPTMLGPLLNCNHIYNQFVIIQDPGTTLKKMELKKRRLQSMSAHSRENSLAKEALDEFLDSTISGHHLLVKAHFNIQSWTDDPAEIRDLKMKVSSAITRTGCTPHLETNVAPLLWYASIPGNAGALPHFETFDTHAEQAACFLMPETNYRSSSSPFGIRLGDRVAGKPTHVDISDEPLRLGQIDNRNKFILGGSG